jgi:riboflavin-specific deaminase-like protein
MQLAPEAAKDADDGAAAAPLGVEEAWQLLLALRRWVDEGTLQTDGLLGLTLASGLWRSDDPTYAELVIDLARGETLPSGRPLAASTAELLTLHLAHALRGRRQGHAVAILGQSLDGFIATRGGDSRYINGEASLVHLHRLRALSDAVVIGVGTALADAPRLTTRHVPGPHAVRVVIDPRGRLPPDSGLLHDGAAPTLVVRQAEAGPSERPLSVQATALHLPARGGAIDPAGLLATLAARGLTRVLVEGGGCTVARFLEAGLLDRLQLAVSPLILGGGRPALPVSPAERLDQALRPPCRCQRMGEDMLFELQLERRARVS